jgi:ABC-type sugar transport system ATPase subunit
VLLLDEPFSNLDAHLRRALRETLKRLRGDSPVATVFVTHDQREALALGDRVAVMKGGRIAQIGTPTELLENPVNRHTASIVRDPPVNFLAGNVQGTRFESPAISFDLRPDHAARLKPGPVVLGIRPEAIQAGPPRENADSVAIPVTRRTSEFLGSSWETRLVLEDGNEFIVLSANAVRERDFHFEKEDIFFFADSDDGTNLIS